MIFFVGMFQPQHCIHFENSFISYNVLKNRKSNFKVNKWILDSGAFTEILKHGDFQTSVSDYAKKIEQLKSNGNLLMAVSQDYLCDPIITQKTGMDTRAHQEKTVERYLRLVKETTCKIMPVLQGQSPKSYLEHIEIYNGELKQGQWVGVGSLVKRNKNVPLIRSILKGIKEKRPDLKLHGFGLKLTSLKDPNIREYLYSADSMAWSYQARMEGRNPNDWREAKEFENRITGKNEYLPLFD